MRVHAATRRVVAEAFAEEKPKLQELPLGRRQSLQPSRRDPKARSRGAHARRRDRVFINFWCGTAPVTEPAHEHPAAMVTPPRVRSTAPASPSSRTEARCLPVFAHGQRNNGRLPTERELHPLKLISFPFHRTGKFLCNVKKYGVNLIFLCKYLLRQTFKDLVFYLSPIGG